MTFDEAEKMVDQHAEALAEHFESVIIICSRPAPSNEKLTAITRKGRGNWFAQQGMMRAVIESDQHSDLALEIIARQKQDRRDSE